VNNAIAAAQLPEEQLQALEDLEARVDTAEIDIDAIEGAVTLTSSGTLYDVNDGTLGVEVLKGEIQVLQGEIVLKAETSDLDAVDTRLTSAEVTIDALDVPTITQTVQDVRGISQDVDDLSELTLKEVLSRYADRKLLDQQVALARTELKADVTDTDEAIATARTELLAQIENNEALIVSEQTARANADSALSQSITTLSAEVNDPDTGLPATFAAVEAEQTARADADTALAQDITELESTVNDETTGLGSDKGHAAE
jgi:hypothetical protein